MVDCVQDPNRSSNIQLNSLVPKGFLTNERGSIGAEKTTKCRNGNQVFFIISFDIYIFGSHWGFTDWFNMNSEHSNPD